MSNKFTYHPTSQKPPPVCKKSIPDALLSYQCPPDIMQVLFSWEDPTLAGGFFVTGTGVFTEFGVPGFYDVIIGDRQGEWIEAIIRQVNDCQVYNLEMFANRGNSFLDQAIGGDRTWQKTRPWDTGLHKITPSGGGKAPSYRVTS